MQKNERVILLHGLGESPLIMSALEVALKKAGYDVSNVAYPSTKYTIETLLETYVEPLLGRWPEAEKVHFVTHSLGGVLLHAALQKKKPANLGRVVMTAPGLHGSEAIEVYRHNWFYRTLFGPASLQSGTGRDAFARKLVNHADYELGVIAGCVPLDLLSMLFVPWPHDGKISVMRTRLRNMADHIVLPTSHDFTSNDPLAIWQVLHFLKHGHFFHLFGRKEPKRLTQQPAAA